MAEEQYEAEVKETNGQALSKKGELMDVVAWLEEMLGIEGDDICEATVRRIHHDDMPDV